MDDREYSPWHQARIGWHINYKMPETLSDQPDLPSGNPGADSKNPNSLHRDNYKLRAKLSIRKDDVQAVLPIAKVINYLINLQLHFITISFFSTRN